jgi:DNA-binding MurR/RpiR family transcriptional regulator
VSFLLDAGARAAAMSAAEIAGHAGTSDATVVRAAQSLGYESLRELRRALTEEPGEADLPARLQATIGAGATPGDLLAATTERQIDALSTLIRNVPPATFEAAVELLVSAPRVWWSGIGPSAHLAGYASFLCRRLGMASDSLVHAGTDQADELLAVGSGDAIVVLAYGRIHPHVRVLVERADEVGAAVILVTDTVGARTKPAVAVQLNAGRGPAGMFATHGPTIVLIEALVLAAAAAEPERAERAVDDLNRIRRSIAGKRVDVDPT